MIVLSRRGTQGDRGARCGRQAPLSRRQGAPSHDVSRVKWARPGDVIAVARKAAKGTA